MNPIYKPITEATYEPITEAIHFDRNKYNILPVGKLRKTAILPTNRFIDDVGNLWVLNGDYYASYHQPTHLYIAAIRSIISNSLFGLFKVPNLKFIRENEDGYISEVVVDRYTGHLITDPTTFGTFNFCRNEDYLEDDIMANGNLPSTGAHKTYDIDPHELWGSKYLHVGWYNNELIKANDQMKVILLDYSERDNRILSYMYNIIFILCCVLCITFFIMRWK